MDTKQIQQQLDDILPDRELPSYIGPQDRKADIENQALKIKADANAKEIARMKYAEKQKARYKQNKIEKHKELAKEIGVDYIPDHQTEHQARELAIHRENIRTLEAIEAQTVQPLHPVELTKNLSSGAPYSSTMTRALQMQGTTRPEVLKLLTSLNINLNIQLSKQDTANLLACLLTCNESQLSALYSNKKVPIAIKTVIKRLQEDARLGNIETVEKLWDRVFGKNAMSLNLPESAQLETGIIPNTPISREAYIVIRDTLIK